MTLLIRVSRVLANCQHLKILYIHIYNYIYIFTYEEYWCIFTRATDPPAAHRSEPLSSRLPRRLSNYRRFTPTQVIIILRRNLFRILAGIQIQIKVTLILMTLVKNLHQQLNMCM
jgi:hypothetical protein